MASLVRRTMIYLGLADDEYEDYERSEEPRAAALGDRRQGRRHELAGAAWRAWVRFANPRVSGLATCSLGWGPCMSSRPGVNDEAHAFGRLGRGVAKPGSPGCCRGDQLSSGHLAIWTSGFGRSSLWSR